jgi:hypothetical protein
LEDLSDASYLGKLLVLPANVGLDWKVIARYKDYSVFCLAVSKKEKKFYNIDTRFFLNTLTVATVPRELSSARTVQ